jgi:hypothetical protein
MFDTGNPEIDAIEDNNSQDMYKYQLLMQDGSNLLAESGDNIILTSYNTTEIDPLADNETYDNIAIADGIIDFTSINPFGEVIKR